MIKSLFDSIIFFLLLEILFDESICDVLKMKITIDSLLNLKLFKFKLLDNEDEVLWRKNLLNHLNENAKTNRYFGKRQNPPVDGE